MEYKWHHSGTLASRPYRCGYCSNNLSSEKGFVATIESYGRSINTAYIYICHFCGLPTLFDGDGEQTPGSKFGEDVSGIEDEKIKKLYDEARNCISANAPTSTVLACRKLLMHIAVEKGAEENLNFIDYVEYLSEKGYIPTDSKEWVDEIREKGNEANHEIVIMSVQDAKDLLKLTEMLLKIIYEFPSEIKKKRAAKT